MIDVCLLDERVTQQHLTLYLIRSVVDDVVPLRFAVEHIHFRLAGIFLECDQIGLQGDPYAPNQVILLAAIIVVGIEQHHEHTTRHHTWLIQRVQLHIHHESLIPPRIEGLLASFGLFHLAATSHLHVRITRACSVVGG